MFDRWATLVVLVFQIDDIFNLEYASWEITPSHFSSIFYANITLAGYSVKCLLVIILFFEEIVGLFE